MSEKKEFTPWSNPQQSLEESVQSTRTTKEIEEGQLAVEGVREKMGQVLKYDQALKISTYEPLPEPVRVEGETWTDHRGRGWIIKNGKKEAHSATQSARRPWWCPVCERGMNSRLDDKMWNLRGKCFACVLADETKMRLDGTYERFEQERILGNQIAWMADRIAEMRGWISALKPAENIFQDGRIERWNVDWSDVKARVSDEIRQLEVLLAQAQEHYQKEFGSETT